MHTACPAAAEAGDLISLVATWLQRRLNDADVKTARGSAWTATAVKRALARL